mmetsp:Transcript_77703/g.140215  ORF Transcript_77703/g.140215 Transcript_77703/m.140215 type:complete len:150 (+) Transcript_77703:3-452(+)
MLRFVVVVASLSAGCTQDLLDEDGDRALFFFRLADLDDDEDRFRFFSRALLLVSLEPDRDLDDDDAAALAFFAFSSEPSKPASFGASFSATGMGSRGGAPATAGFAGAAGFAGVATAVCAGVGFLATAACLGESIGGALTSVSPADFER